MWGRVSSNASGSSNHHEAAPAVVARDAGTGNSSRARAAGTAEHGSGALGAGTAVGGGLALPEKLAAEQQAEQQAGKQAEQQKVVRFEVCSSGQGGAVVVADGRAVVRRPPRVHEEALAPPLRWCSKL